jgi:hypothetical protein
VRTYGTLVREVDAWVIGELEPHVRIKLKAIFTKVPKLAPPPYRFPATAETAADLLWFIDRYPLRTSAADLDALVEGRMAFEATQAEVARVMSPDWTPPAFAGLKPGQAVRPYQARNVELLARFGGLLVADRVGKGKTYTALAACLLPGALPATIVVPPHLRLQWRDKIEEFTTLSAHVVTSSRPYELPPVDVRIFGYTQLAGWIDVLSLLGTGLAVCDEGHDLRHGLGTAKGAAADALYRDARLKLMLSATPVFHYGLDIWTLLRFVRPEVLGGYDDFAREWCGRGAQVADPVALNAYLREQHAMVRGEGGDPEPNRLVQSVPHDAEHLKSVEAAITALARVARYGAFEEAGRATRELDMRLRLETGVAKAPFVAQFVRALVEETGEPVVLFGWHREVYRIWNEALSDLGVVMYTGSESPAQKNQAVQTFVRGGAQVFIISLRSGAGLDGLQHRASTVIFGELDWSPAMHDQCIGRLNREGQRRWPRGELVDAIFLVADDGSDPPMVEMLGLKASQARGVTDGVLGPQRVVSDRKPIEMLIERYLRDEEAA